MITKQPAGNPQLFSTTLSGVCTLDPNEHHFRTDHLLGNLRSHAISSGFVTMSAQAARFLLNLAYTMIMARLLAPPEFGVVAMVTTVTVLIGMVADGGLFTATLQRQHITHAQVSNLFWVNVATSGLLALILAALAPALAAFYHEPRVEGIALVLSLSFPLTGCAAQHFALLSRQMRFKAKAGIEVISLGVGCCAGLGMALLQFRYWSLVGATLATAAVGCLLAWLASGWRPQPPRKRSGTASLIGFGANLSVGQLIYSIARCSDILLIGRFFGSGATGLYSRASILLMRPLEQFLRPIDAVFEPTLSRLQSEPERYRRTFLQVYCAIALISFLFTGIFLALPHPLILVTLGPKWEKADAIFAGFTLVALFFPLAKPSEWLFTSQGRGRDSLAACVAQAVVSVLSFLVGLPFGPAGIAISFSVACLVIQLPILNYIAGRRGPVSTLDLWTVFFSHLPLWIIVFTVTRLTYWLIPHVAPIGQVMIPGFAGAVVGIGFIWTYAPTRRTALSLLDVLRELKSLRAKAAEGPSRIPT
jgi:O-antigen/teichoic acid export membrane protein